MIRYFFGLLLAAVSLYIASLYESTAIVLLGFIHVFLMLLSLVSLLYEKRSLQVTLEVDLCEFEASLVYISSFRIPRAIAQRNSVLRNKAKQNAMFTHPRE